MCQLYVQHTAGCFVPDQSLAHFPALAGVYSSVEIAARLHRHQRFFTSLLILSLVFNAALFYRIKPEDMHVSHRGSLTSLETAMRAMRSPVWRWVDHSRARRLKLQLGRNRFFRNDPYLLLYYGNNPPHKGHSA